MTKDDPFLKQRLTMVATHNIHINHSSSNLTSHDKSSLSDFQNLSQGDLSLTNASLLGSPNVNARREATEPTGGMRLAEYENNNNTSEIPEFTDELLKRES